MPHSSSRYWLSGLLFAVAGTLLFSLKPILIKQVYLFPVHSDQLITLRMLFAAPVYFLVAISQCQRHPTRRRLAWQRIGQVMVLGILGYYVASYLDLIALHYITAQLERLVLFCFPTLVVLMSRWFFRTPLPSNIGWVLGLSYCGILLIFGHDMLTFGDEVAYGTLLVLGSAVSFAIYTLWSKPLIAQLGSRLFTSLAMLSASVAIFVHFTLGGDLLQRLSLPVQVYELIGAIAILCTVVPSFLVAEAVNRLGPERTSIIGTSGPVMTAVIAVSWLGEAFTIYHLAGLTLVVMAVWLMIKNDRKRAGQ